MVYTRQPLQPIGNYYIYLYGVLLLVSLTQENLNTIDVKPRCLFCYYDHALVITIHPRNAHYKFMRCAASRDPAADILFL